jgi:hypothetical protein
MPKRAEGYPQLWGNVNSPPVLIYQPEQAQDLGSAWRRIDLTPFLPQPAPPLPDVPPVTLSPTSAGLPATPTNGSFAVTVTGPGTSGTWTAEKDAAAAWLAIQAPLTPQSADGTVEYAAGLNSGAERTANIYVNGKTFKVTQAGV